MYKLRAIVKKSIKTDYIFKKIYKFPNIKNFFEKVFLTLIYNMKSAIKSKKKN